LRAREGEGLAELGGAAAEGSRLSGCASLAHGVDAFDGLEGADEDGDGLVGFPADDVEAVVHAIGEVDVGGARGCVHGLVAGCAPGAEAVGGAVADAEVGLGLDDEPGEARAVGEDADEEGAEQ
jgi:hypothetical protein